MKNRFVVLIGMLLSVFGALAVMDNTYAADEATIMKKWAFTQYYECVKNNINSPIEQKNSGVVSENVFPKSGELWLPSYKFQNNVNSGKVNCYDLFLGKASGLSFGILGYAGINDNVNWSNPSGSQAFLENLGYTLENNGEQRFTIQASERTEMENYSIFSSTEHVLDRDAGSLVITVSDNDEGTKTYSYDSGFLGLNNAMSAIQVGFSDHKMKVAVDVSAVSGCSNLYLNQEEWFPLKNDVQEFYNDLKSGLANKTWGYICNNAYGRSKTTYSFAVDPDDTGIVNSGDAGRFVYAKDQNRYDVSDNVIKSMSGIDIRGLILDNNELYTLYYYYLEKSLPTGVANRITCNPSNTNNLTAINLKDVDGQVKTCYVNFNGVDPGSISVYTQSHTNLGNRQPFPFITAITMQDVINWFNSVDASTLTDVGVITDSNNESNNQEGTSGGDGDVCYNGAGVLGWIVCPVTQGLTDLGAKAYKWVEENFLQVETSIFSEDSNSEDSNSEDSNGVRTAWSTIRNIANVGFIIMLLLVIVSQVTGFGIDNYGIKRILPKLIVGAIVMNLSYIICELMIDVSNIAGSGLKDILTGMGPDLPTNASSYAASGGQYATVFGVTTIAVAIGMILSSGGLGAILMLFVALLSVVIAILVLFVVLIVRQAGIVVCVVIAPIAVMCYLLPNTEKYFKKWFDLMKGLLLVYPLCGLIIGAGDFIGRIFGNLAANSNDDLQMGFALSAMVVTAIPYLFIPTLLKSSLAAMGNLGAKISGLGARLRGGVSKKVQGSDAMKASRQRANDSRIMRKAGFSEKKGGLNAVGRAKAKFAKTKVGGLIGYTRMQNARVQSAEKIADMNKEAAASLSSETAAADIAEYVSKNPGKGTNDFFQEQIDNAGGDIRKLDAVILTAQKRGVRNKDIAAMIRKSQNSGKLKFANDASKANWMNSMLRNHGDIMATDYDLQEWARDGGNNALGDYGDYMGAHRGVSDVDISDLSKMSGNSLAGAIRAGLVSSSVAQQWLASNPNQSPDKKVMMGAVASGAVTQNSVSGISADDLKKEADALASGNYAAAPTIVGGAVAVGKSDGTSGSMERLVSSWTTTAQTRAYVSQDSSTLRPGQEQKEPVWVTLRQGTDQGGSFDVRALDSETLLDIATNPNATNGDVIRNAAEQEFLRRNPGFNSEARGEAGTNNPQPPKIPPQQG